MARKFGVEIECVGVTPRQGVAALQDAGLTVSDNTNYRHTGVTEWKVVTDASVGGGVELVSPILQGDEGLEDVRKACRAIVAAGASVNRNCGLHVHVDARRLTGPQVANVVFRYARFEEQIDGFMPPSRRGNYNQYCQSIIGQVRHRRSQMQNASHANQVVNQMYDRYLKLNLQSYTRQGSIEFRQHSGTVNATKVTNWIQFCLNFVEESIRTAPENASNSTDSGEAASSSPRLRALALTLAEGRRLYAEGLAERSGYSESSIPGAIARLRREHNVRIRCSYGLYYTNGTSAETLRRIYSEETQEESAPAPTSFTESQQRSLMYSVGYGGPRRVAQIMLANPEVGFTVAQLSARTGYSGSSIRNYFTQMRQAGISIRRQGTRADATYRVVVADTILPNAESTSTTAAQTSRVSWEEDSTDTWCRGLDPEVRSYYIERAQDFAPAR